MYKEYWKQEKMNKKVKLIEIMAIKELRIFPITNFVAADHGGLKTANLFYIAEQVFRYLYCLILYITVKTTS